MFRLDTVRAASAAVGSFVMGCVAVCLGSLAAVPAAALAQVAAQAPQAAQPPRELTQLLPSFVTSCPKFPPAVDSQRQSVYVPVADGVKLAVDIYVPKGAAPGTKFPVLYTATRYWRAPKDAALTPVQQEWLARGFVVANADVRGTGASFGQWYIPYSAQEVHDIGFLAGWLARQPWSDGNVVMTGNSYTGTTSLVGAAYADGAIKAVAPKFSDFDFYADLLFPGGVAAEQLSLDWGHLVHRLDQGQMNAGVRPVDGADGQSLLDAAVHGHNPGGFDQVPYLVTYADDPIEAYHGMSMIDASAYTFRKPLEQSRVPIFGWGSWLDSGIAQGLLNRFMTFSNPQLTIIGPWTHGARDDVNVFAPTEELEPSRTEQERMVACYLGHYIQPPQAAERSGAAQTGRAQHTLVYFTMGENRWRSTDTWPIPGTQLQRYYLGDGHSLATGKPADGGEDSYKVDFEASTGPANRWATQAGGPRIDYADRAAADQRLLTYTSGPLAGDIEITGQPVITLVVRSNHTDGNFFAYLEDVAPDGHVTYLTEGQLRALHRKLSSGPAPYKTTYPYRSFVKADGEPLVPGQQATLTFQLQATSVLLSRGHRIRVALGGADKGNFIRRPSPEEGDVTIQVARGGAHVSFIELPVVPRRP